MTTIAENSNRDIFVDPKTGNLALLSGLDQCGLNCKAAMEVVLTECVLDLSRGLPYEQTMWNSYLPRQFESAARRVLRTVLNVVSVVSFAISKSGDVASYTAVIQTTFGKNLTVLGVIPNVV